MYSFAVLSVLHDYSIIIHCMLSTQRRNLDYTRRENSVERIAATKTKQPASRESQLGDGRFTL